MIRVACLGGAGSVTGSNYLVESPQGKNVLVDCGLFQGGRQMESRNRMDWGFDPQQMSTLFLTHAHIDHSGRIPKLVKDGFQGKIITSPPTAELCRIMLLDSAHIQELDAEWQTRRNKRQSKGPVLPLYTTEDAETSLKLLMPMDRDQVIDVEPGIKARHRNAGQPATVLFSSSETSTNAAEFDLGSTRLAHLLHLLTDIAVLCNCHFHLRSW